MYINSSKGLGQTIVVRNEEERVNCFLGEPQSTPTMNCPNYDRSEVQKSRTAQGHLPSDVIEHPRGLLIADFLVNWRTPRESLKRDGLLQGWLRTMGEVIRANPSTKIRILGFSDCVGNEKNNNLLRRGRALRVLRLLNQMLGNGIQWNSFKSKIEFARAAPAGEYVSDNSTVEGRAQNRGVLIEHQRSIDMKPTAVAGCVVRPSQALVYPMMRLIPNVPFDRSKLPLTYRLDAKKIVGETAKDISQNGHKAGFVIEAAHWGIVALEIFAEAGILAIAAPMLAAVAGFLALGAGCAGVAEEVAKNWSARGYSRGIVVGANGRKARELKQRFGNDCCPPDNFCDTEKIAKANYLMGLFVGYMHGRMLCPNQREWFWRDLGHRMGDQFHLGPSTRWSDHDWTLWYASAAGTFRAHLD